MRTPPVRCGGERGMDTRFTPPAMKGHTQSTFHDDEFPRDPLPADSFGPPFARIRGLPFIPLFHSHLQIDRMPAALWVSVLAEFIGTFLFQLLGGSARTGLHNGVVLTVLIYMTGREAHSTLSCPFPHSPDTLTVRSRGEWRCAQSCRGHGTSGRRRDGSPQVGVLRRG